MSVEKGQRIRTKTGNSPRRDNRKAGDGEERNDDRRDKIKRGLTERERRGGVRGMWTKQRRGGGMRVSC